MREWLKGYRHARRMTQEEVSLLSGISRSYYTCIEQGTKTPSVEVAKKIAKSLRFDWVIFFNDDCSLEEQVEEVS